MKTYILFALFFISYLSFSQDTEYTIPDLEQIEKNIKDQNSDLFYGKLMQRFEKGDSTMSISEKMHLYYGYTFQPEYEPYERLSIIDEQIADLLKNYDLSTDELEKVISLCDLRLAEYPFELQSMEYKIYAYKELGDENNTSITANQAGIVLDAILSTGDGTEISTAIHVIDIRNEYSLINILGFNFGGNQELVTEGDHKYDFLTLSENGYNLEGLYFDVCSAYNTISID